LAAAHWLDSKNQALPQLMLQCRDSWVHKVCDERSRFDRAMWSGVPWNSELALHARPFTTSERVI
jgi:hypothetical protein